MAQRKREIGIQIKGESGVGKTMLALKLVQDLTALGYKVQVNDEGKKLDTKKLGFMYPLRFDFDLTRSTTIKIEIPKTR